jgi:transposase-like protein
MPSSAVNSLLRHVRLDGFAGVVVDPAGLQVVLGHAKTALKHVNRAENSHQPTRQRERAMKRFASPRQAQRFLSAFSGITPHFRLRRHLLSASEWRREMTDRFAVWNEITGLSAAP